MKRTPATVSHKSKIARIETALERYMPDRIGHRRRGDLEHSFGRALLAYDAGDKPTARKLFKNVLQAQPDFELAQRDLDRLIQ